MGLFFPQVVFEQLAGKRQLANPDRSPWCREQTARTGRGVRNWRGVSQNVHPDYGMGCHSLEVLTNEIPRSLPKRVGFNRGC